MEHELTENEKAVLRVLYEAKEDAAKLTVAMIGEKAGMSEATALKTLNRLHVLGYVAKPALAEFALSAVDEALRATDPNAKCELPERVLMASIMIGSGDEERICRMGLPADEVRKVGDRLRRNGVWDAGGVDEPASGMDFALMCCIASGHMSREHDRSDGEWKYSMTPEGKRHVEDALKNR